MAREYWEDEFLEDEEEQPDIMDLDPQRGQSDLDVLPEVQTGTTMSQEELLEEFEKIPVPELEKEAPPADPIRPELSISPKQFELYHNDLTRGFIPFEIRPGFRGGNEEKLTTDMIQTIREEYNPNFGYTLGIDTTEFSTKRTADMGKTASVVRLEYEDIKPLINEQEYQAEDFKDIRMYKEYGASQSVDGIQVGMANLCTLELTRVDDGRVLREHFAIDDTGTVRGVLGLGMEIDTQKPVELEMANRESGILMSPNVIEGEPVVIGKLDRTNPDNPGHFKNMEGKDQAFRDEFRSKVDAAFPDFCKSFCEDISKTLQERKGMLEGQIQYVKDLRADVGKALNILELDKEGSMSDTYANLQELRSTFSDCFWGKDLSEIPDEQLAKGLEAYREYTGILDKIGFRAKDDITNALAIKSDSLSKYEQTLCRERDRYFDFGQVTSDGVLIRDSFVDGTHNRDGVEETLSPEDRFHLLCKVELTGGAGIPSVIMDEIKTNPLDGFREEIKEGFDRVVGRFEAYNETVTEVEKVHVTDDMELYTGSGFRITADVVNDGSLRELNPDDVIPREGLFELYDRKETTAEAENIQRPTALADSTDVKNFLEARPEGVDKTRGEIRKNAIDTAIFKGQDRELIIGKPIDPLRKIGAIDRTHGDLNGKSEYTYYYDKDAVKNLLIRESSVKTDVQDYIETALHVVDHVNKEGPLNLEAVKEDTGRLLEEKQTRDVEAGGVAPVADTVEVGKTANAGSSEKDFEKAVNKISHGAYGKTDNTKGVEIAAEKKQELLDEAFREEKDPDKAEKLYAEKLEALQEKLEIVRNDIIYYEGKMDIQGIPPRIVYMHNGFQQAKLEYDSAIRMYAHLGGASGEDKFVTKVPKAEEVFSDKMQDYFCEYHFTVLLERLAGRDFSLRDLYQDSQGNTHLSYQPGFKQNNMIMKLEGPAKVIAKPLYGLSLRILDKVFMGDMEKIADYFERQVSDLDVNEQKEDPVADQPSNDNGADVDQDMESNNDPSEKNENDLTEKEEDPLTNDQKENKESGEEGTRDVEKESNKTADGKETESNDKMEKEDPGPADRDPVDPSDTEKENRIDENNLEQQSFSDEIDGESGIAGKGPALDRRMDRENELEAKVDLAAASGSGKEVDKQEPEDKDRVEKDEDFKFEDRMPWEVEKDEDGEDPKDERDSTDREKEEDTEKPERDDPAKPEREDVERPEKEEPDNTEKSDTEKVDADKEEKEETGQTEKDHSSQVEKEDGDQITKEEEEHEPFETRQDEFPEDRIVGADLPEPDQEMTDTELQELDFSKQGIDPEEDLDVEPAEGIEDELSFLDDVQDAVDQDDGQPIGQEDLPESALSTPEDIAPDHGAMPDEVENPASGSTREDLDPVDAVKEELKAVLDGDEELNVVMEHITDFMLDDEFGADDLISYAADAIDEYLKDTGLVDDSIEDQVSDISFEIVHLDGDPFDNMDRLNELLDQGDHGDFAENNLSHMADLYEEGLVTAEAHGELDGTIFAEDGVTDYSGEIPSFDQSDMDRINQDVSSDMADRISYEDAAHDLVEQIESGLIDQGIEAASANDIAASMEDSIMQDLQNGVDIHEDAYTQNVMENAMGQAQNDDSFKNMDMPQNDFGLEDVNQALDAAANDGTADLLADGSTAGAEEMELEEVLAALL